MPLIFVNRFYAPDHSATSQILTDLTAHLAREGRAVRVIASRMRYDDPAAVLPARETIGGVEVIRVATTRFGRGSIAGRLIDYASFYLSASWAMLRTVRRGDVLVAKTDPPLISVPAAVVAKLRGARLVNWLQDLYPEVAQAMGVPGTRGPIGGIARSLRNWALRAADLNVAIGAIMAERLRACGVAAERIAIVPNWSNDGAVMPVAHGDNPLRAEWGYGPGDFVVAYSGNLGRAHEAETLLAAATALKDEADLHFLFVGGGHHVAELSARAAAAGLTRIAFRPYQPRDRLAQSLSTGDVHWLSLRPEFEGLIVPSKVFGIAAVARPILAVADPDGEVGRMIAAHGSGIAVAPGNVTGLCAAIMELKQDRARCVAMGRAARTMLEDEFTQARSLERFALALARVGTSTAGPQLGAGAAGRPGGR